MYCGRRIQTLIRLEKESDIRRYREKKLDVLRQTVPRLEEIKGSRDYTRIPVCVPHRKHRGLAAFTGEDV